MDHLTELDHSKKVSLLFQIIIRSRNSGDVSKIFWSPVYFYDLEAFIVEIFGWIQTDMPEPGGGAGGAISLPPPIFGR